MSSPRKGNGEAESRLACAVASACEPACGCVADNELTRLQGVQGAQTDDQDELPVPKPARRGACDV